MKEDESDELLRTHLEGIDITSAELSALSAKLEHLPLALVQAAAFIQENAIEDGEYLRLLDKAIWVSLTYGVRNSRRSGEIRKLLVQWQQHGSSRSNRSNGGMTSRASYFRS
jgi:hypothetical protein